MLEKLNIESKFVEGLRVTNEETVKIVEMVLSGSINKDIVNKINKTNSTAVGLSGKDGKIIFAQKLKSKIKDKDSNIEKFLDIGFVGEPQKINPSIINQLSSNHYTLPLTARRVDTIDTDNDGDREIIYLSNREDGRNRKSSWKDVNYIFDLNDNSLSKFGSSHFSHDLMYTDFDNDGFFEVIDYVCLLINYIFKFLWMKF